MTRTKKALRMKKSPAVVKIGHIYKITYPNGKIYIGQDRTDDIMYFGSPNRAYVSCDFTAEERRDMTIRREILVEAFDITIVELNRLEREYIARFRSHDPQIGYNKMKFKKEGDAKCKSSK